MHPRLGVAQILEPLHVAVGAAATHDSNVFRLPQSVDPESVGRPGRSDTVRSAYVGLRLDKAYSLQRLQLDVTETAYRYDTFTQLDFDALNYRAAWLWQLTSRLSGTLSADHVEAAVPFYDFEGTQQNTRTTDIRAFSAEAALHGGWHLVFAAAENQQRSSIPIATFADSDFTKVEAGVRYGFRSGNSVGLVHRVNEGEYRNQPLVSGSSANNDFRERQNEVTVSWSATGRSTLNARLARLDRHHAAAPDRDFSATAGNLGYVWSPTGKVQLGLTAQRDVFASLDPLVSHTQRDIVSLTPVWQASAKVAIRAQLSRIHTEFQSAQAAPARRDDIDVVELGFDWRATRSIAFNASARDERRSSSDPGLDFRALIYRISGSLTF
jgi:exopolysaccharide biosynthesis operon protein EpsL